MGATFSFGTFSCGTFSNGTLDLSESSSRHPPTTARHRRTRPQRRRRPRRRRRPHATARHHHRSHATARHHHRPRADALRDGTRMLIDWPSEGLAARVLRVRTRLAAQQTADAARAAANDGHLRLRRRRA